VQASACTYREAVTVSKPLTIIGSEAGGTQIKGSDVWTKWTKNSSGDFVSASSVPLMQTHGKCEEGTSVCLWPEQVFVNGAPLRQVASGSNPAVGQFKLNTKRKVVMGTSPSNNVVEVTVRQHWLIANANNVVVKNVDMHHAGNAPQGYGALRAADGYDGFQIHDSELSYAHGALFAFAREGQNQLVHNVNAHHGGQLGLHGCGLGTCTVRNSEIHHNNFEDFAHGWEAGAMKFVRTKSLVFDNNEVYSNDGNGFWCDIECTNVEISNNKVFDNYGIGIFFEISGGDRGTPQSRIHHNAAWNNGWGEYSWVWDAQIVSSTSKNV